jgi:hypothetical protein
MDGREVDGLWSRSLKALLSKLEIRKEERRNGREPERHLVATRVAIHLPFSYETLHA